MQTSRPIDSQVTGLFVKFHSPCNAATRRELAEFIQTVKYGAVLSYIDCNNNIRNISLIPYTSDTFCSNLYKYQKH